MITLAAPPRLTSADGFLEMEPVPGKRYELIRGVIKEKDVGTGYPHAVTVSCAHGVLFAYVAGADYGELLTGEPGFRLESGPDTVRCPDIAWFAPGRIPPGTAGFPDLVPDLCVEVASPSNSRRDRLLSHKAQMWLDFGVREVWVLNPEPVTVTRYRPGQLPTVLGADDTLYGDDLLPNFSVSVWQLFRRRR